MPLVSMKDMLLSAKEHGYAVPGFTVINIEMARACVLAAEEAGSPAIISYAYDFEPVVDIHESAPMLLALAQRSACPVAVHLDHARNIDCVKEAMDCGFSSAMIDASAKPYSENVRATCEVVKLCERYGASVEAELGHVGGLDWQYGAGNEEIAYTDVKEACDFVAETGVDALAVAIGTVHGVYRSTPHLNIQRLSELSGALAVPLVMHGGSGLSDEDFKAAVKNGICKINIHTDLCQAAIAAMGAGIKDKPYLGIIADVEQAVKERALHKYRTFGCIKVL